MKRDPVCGRRISERKAHAVACYGGGRFLLCCPRCKAAFERAPARYVGRSYPDDEDLKIVVGRIALVPTPR